MKWNHALNAIDGEIKTPSLYPDHTFSVHLQALNKSMSTIFPIMSVSCHVCVARPLNVIGSRESENLSHAERIRRLCKSLTSDGLMAVCRWLDNFLSCVKSAEFSKVLLLHQIMLITLSSSSAYPLANFDPRNLWSLTMSTIWCRNYLGCNGHYCACEMHWFFNRFDAVRFTAYVRTLLDHVVNDSKWLMYLARSARHFFANSNPRYETVTNIFRKHLGKVSIGTNFVDGVEDIALPMDGGAVNFDFLLNFLSDVQKPFQLSEKTDNTGHVFELLATVELSSRLVSEPIYSANDDVQRFGRNLFVLVLQLISTALPGDFFLTEHGTALRSLLRSIVLHPILRVVAVDDRPRQNLIYTTGYLIKQFPAPVRFDCMFLRGEILQSMAQSFLDNAYGDRNFIWTFAHEYILSALLSIETLSTVLRTSKSWHTLAVLRCITMSERSCMLRLSVPIFCQ